MQPNLLQFLVIRWSILINSVVILSPHNLGTRALVSTLVLEEDENGFADFLFRHGRRRSEPR
jgi:hypothetical protein